MLSNRPSIPYVKVFQVSGMVSFARFACSRIFLPTAHMRYTIGRIRLAIFVLVWLLARCACQGFFTADTDSSICPVRTKIIPCRGDSRFPKVILPVSLQLSPCLLVGKCSVLELILIRRAAVAWVLPIRKLDFTPIHFQCLRHGLERKYFWYLRGC